MAYSSYLVHGCFFKGTFYKKREFRLLKPHKLMQFLIVRNGNIFFQFSRQQIECNSCMQQSSTADSVNKERCVYYFPLFKTKSFLKVYSFFGFPF